MRPLVSVVIPAFNAERFLATTLSSVQKQTYDTLEVLVVDDGSTDATARIAEQYARADPRIRIMTQSNGGVASARNLGLRHARSEYVAFLDADDIWHPTKIERQLKVLLRGQAAAVYALYRLIDVQDRVIESGPFWRTGGALPTHLVTWPIGNGSSIMTRRDLALAVGGFDPTYRDLHAGGSEDLDFELKLAARFPISVIPEYLVGYRSYEGNMSSDKDRMARSVTALVEKHIRLNPDLSKKCANWARGNRDNYCFVIYFQQRHFRNALKMMARMISSDPVMAAYHLSWQLPKVATRWAYRRLCQSVGYPPIMPPGIPFSEYNPLKADSPPNMGSWFGIAISHRLKTWRLRHLAREDATWSASKISHGVDSEHREDEKLEGGLH